MPQLENWSIISSTIDPYKAPELSKPALRGNVFGHPRFEDGKLIHTSSIAGITKENHILTHSGSKYMLGEIDSEFDEMYPNAKERLIKSLKR